MARKTLIELASPNFYGPGSGAVPTISMMAVLSVRKLAFKASVKGARGNFDIADDSGRVRIFRDADDVFTQMGALSMVPDSLTVAFSAMSLVAPKPFTGDMIKKAESMQKSYGKRSIAVSQRYGKLQTEAALMQGDATVSQERRDENAAQFAAVTTLNEFLWAELDRLRDIVGHPG